MGWTGSSWEYRFLRFLSLVVVPLWIPVKVYTASAMIFLVCVDALDTAGDLEEAIKARDFAAYITYFVFLARFGSAWSSRQGQG